MEKSNSKTNIVLIGMAGSGKSTVGRELARVLSLVFVDVDTLIEENRQVPLQELLDGLGVQGFRKVEELILLSINVKRHVIATGGSAIYSQAGMDHLRKNSVLVLLDVDIDTLKQRVGDFSDRGLVKTRGQSFDDVYGERQPLYKKNADIVVDCRDQSVSAICDFIVAQIADSSYHF